MEDTSFRFLSDLVNRLSGPLMFRFILQPVMACIYAYRDGVRDAREGRPAYLWTVFRDPAERHRLLQEGWRAVSRVILLAVLMELVYQYIVFRAFRPLELLTVVLTLAFVPYLLLRGPINRFASRHWRPAVR